MKLKQLGKVSQPLMVAILAVITLVISTAIWFSSRDSVKDEHGHDESAHGKEEKSSEGHAEDEEGHGHEEESEGEHAEEGEIP